MPSSFEIRIRIFFVIKRVSDCFWPNDPQIVSTITKPDANYVDAQSQGW
jgi:hypothetical protein